MPTTKPDLMAELAEVVRLMKERQELFDARKYYSGDLLEPRISRSAVDLIRTHHAELEAVVRDARRLDWLESMANKPGGLLLHDGSESGRCGLGLRPGAANRDLRTAIDQAMNNNAREG